MGSLSKIAGALLLISACLRAAPQTTSTAPREAAPQKASTSLQEARAYSFLIRDQGLHRSETMALLQNASTLSDFLPQWLASKEHKTRMERYFDDMMGFREQLNAMQPNARLSKTADGVFFSPQKGRCQATEAGSASAWWLPEGTSALFCPNLLQSALTVKVDGKTIFCTRAGRRGFLHPRCGCGPDMISCIAPEEANRLQQEVQQEFSQRAWQVYQNSQNWIDLLAGNQFYGTRRLYWLYFHSQSLLDPKHYTDEALKTLRSVSLDEPETLAFPAGAERAGIATAPGFLVQFNNFRSRIAGLTRSFLCQDVNPTLNTDGISTFVNPSLSPADLAHGEKEDCSSCHYALDNLGGAVMPWTDRGVYRPEISTEAHAFGERGQGPTFLMQGFVERGPGFQDCMARRAWEDFSGQAWNQTPDTVKAKVRSWVDGGPRTLIHTLLLSTELQAALAKDFDMDQNLDLSAEKWADIRSIVQSSCGGSSCHSSGARQPAYAETSALWVKDREKIKERLQKTGVGRMPPLSSGRALSEEDRQSLLHTVMQ